MWLVLFCFEGKGVGVLCSGGFGTLALRRLGCLLLGIALLWVFVWVGGNERRVEIKSGVWRFCFRSFDLVLSGLPLLFS